MKKLAIFASGRGSNALKIIEYAQKNKSFEVALVVSNKADAPILSAVQDYNIPVLVIKRESFYASAIYVDHFKSLDIDLIILAGFLWLVPRSLVDAYPLRIINIHPSLLPKYGGKGMYGMFVHEAVHEAKESKAGITIHYVNEYYDKGQIILQAATKISDDDLPTTIAQKVLRLEHYFFSRIVEAVALRLN